MGNQRTYTLPAPYSGLNKVDALNNLAPSEALEMKNCFSEDGKVIVRTGTSEFHEGTDGIAGSQPVKTVASFPANDGTYYLMYDNGTYPRGYDGSSDSALGSDFTAGAGIYHSVVFNNELFTVPGEGGLVSQPSGMIWDGSTASYSTFNSFVGPVVSITAYKGALYFADGTFGTDVVINYGDLNAVAGDLNSFNVGYILKYGGEICKLGSFANTSSSIIDDLFYVLSTEGELLFYSGDNPGADNWELVAQFKIGKPLGYRAAFEVENDVIFITDRGLVSCKDLFSGNPTTAIQGFGRKVNKIIRDYAEDTPFSYLWTGLYHGLGSKIFITLPASGTINNFLVYNINNGSWSIYEYTLNFYSMCLHDGDVLCGGDDTKIYQLETGTTESSAMDIELKYGHNNLGSSKFKRITAIRPLIKTVGEVDLTVNALMDYQETTDYDNIIKTRGSTSTAAVKYDRFDLSGSGHTLALHITGTLTNVPLEIFAFDISIEDGTEQ